jgi:hypothetical protein
MCVTEPDGDDAVLTGEGVQPIERQEASFDIQGANVQVCFNESTNLQGRKNCYCNKSFC